METTRQNAPGGKAIVIASALFAALLPVALHAVYFTGDRILYGMDAAQLQYPRYRILCDALQSGQGIPLWQTLLYTGSPFHANPENPTLYPPVLLFARWCTPIWTMHLTILLHLALAGLGMFLLVRRLWLRLAADRPFASAIGAEGGALIAAALFSLSYWTRLDHFNLVAYGASHALIPWILLCADALLEGPRPARAAGGLGLLLGLQVLTGGLYVIPYSALALAAWMILLGVCGGSERARRALLYGCLAACIALAVCAGKLLPYVEWIGTTNRAEGIDAAELRGMTLGGLSNFSWATAWTKIAWHTFYGLSIALALTSLVLLRHRLVRVALALALFFFALSLGGELHRWVAKLPLLDQTRHAVRAWTGVNVFLPLLAGLGCAALLARTVGRIERPGARAWTALCGAAIAALLSPWLCKSFRYDVELKSPERFDEVISRYERWPEVARRCGDEWRAMYPDRSGPDERNEQFISTILGVETPAGYLGHVWPRELERHLYGVANARVDDVARFRRRSTLSVRWLVTTSGALPVAENAERTEPWHIDGNTLVENPLARPRAIEACAVAAIYGDGDSKATHTMIEEGIFPIPQVGVLQVEDTRELAAAELEAIDVLVLRGEPSTAACAVEAAMLAAGKPVKRIAGARGADDEFSAEDRAALSAAVRVVAEAALVRATPVARFERLGMESTRIVRPDAARARFVFVSEPWALYPGWSAHAEADAKLELAILRADGATSAVFVPAGVDAFVARYAPPSFRRGLAISAGGWLLALALLAWPAFRAAADSARARS